MISDPDLMLCEVVSSIFLALWFTAALAVHDAESDDSATLEDEKASALECAAFSVR